MMRRWKIERMEGEARSGVAGVHRMAGFLAAAEAELRGYLGAKKEEGEGYKRRMVVLPLPLVVVRIEEGRSTGSGG